MVNESYIARLDGVGQNFWEPLWQVGFDLLACERELLTCPVLRRLHFIHHAGASYICTQHTQTRLQHTLGVLSLVAHFAPADEHLRAAALLHDVGHGPFSHSLEQIPGVDHHQMTAVRILSDPIRTILERHGLDSELVLAYADGRLPSVLSNNSSILHADHLDSFVRNAQARGHLRLSPPAIRQGTRLEGSYLDFDQEVAEMLVSVIVEEAEFHCSSANIGPDAILKHLLLQLCRAEVVPVPALCEMSDDHVAHLLSQTPATMVGARRLWWEPHTIKVRRQGSGEAPAHAHRVKIDELYLPTLLVQGRSIRDLSPGTAEAMQAAQELRGTYTVSWE